MGKYALIIVSALVFSIITYSFGLRSAMFSSTLRNVDTFSNNQAHNIAQSTMMVVMSDIRENGTDSQFMPAQDGSYQFPNDGLEQWGDINGSYRVITNSTGDTLFVSIEGDFEGNRSMVRAGLLEEIPDWNPQFTSAVHSEASIELQGSASIQGDASINSTDMNAVVLAWSTQIDSTLYIGPGGNPDVVVDEKNHSGNVGLGVEVMGEELDYPMPLFPEYPSKEMYGASVYVSGSTSRTLEFNDYDGFYLPEVNVTSNTHLTIEVDGESTLHVGNFNIIQGHVHLTGSGSLTIVIEDNFTISGSSTINNSGSVNDFFIYYGGTTNLSFAGLTVYNGGIFVETADVTISGSNSLKGSLISGGDNITVSGAASANSRVIYAPNSHVSMSGSSVIYGSVISSSFIASGAARVQFNEVSEEDLPDLSAGDGPVYSLLFWN
tara:strand:- start:54613 stop:55920 length:1308 start_codon:yes stop_codon:yes gene_type:complete